MECTLVYIGTRSGTRINVIIRIMSRGLHRAEAMILRGRSRVEEELSPGALRSDIPLLRPSCVSDSTSAS